MHKPFKVRNLSENVKTDNRQMLDRAIQQVDLLDKQLQTQLIYKKKQPQPSSTHKFMKRKSQVENYILGEQIGKGSYAIVKEGKDEKDESQVAIKIYDKMKLFDNMRKQNLNREIELLKGMDHENIIKLIKVVETKDQVKGINLVMEKGGQESLKSYLKKFKKLPFQEVQSIMRSILLGLNYIHSKGIIHRDIKLDNILMDDCRQLLKSIINLLLGLKLLTLALLSNLRICKLEYFVGHPTIWHLRQFPKLKSILLSNRSISYSTGVDIWAAGVIMYQLITGTYPFSANSERELFEKILKGKFKKTLITPSKYVQMLEGMLATQNNRFTAQQVCLENLKYKQALNYLNEE